MLKIVLFFILSEGASVFEEVLQGESCISHLQRFKSWSLVQTYLGRQCLYILCFDTKSWVSLQRELLLGEKVAAVANLS